MFSGIVEKTASLERIDVDRDNRTFTFRTPMAAELKIDQSVAHNGVCLTVVGVEGDTYAVTAMRETLNKSNLGSLKPGDLVNLERAMRPDALLDGHIVQGHVDTTARCTAVEEAEGSWYFTFEYDESPAEHVTVDKGSVAVNGVSLTVCDSEPGRFRVAIIPYTYDHTNFHDIKVGSTVNLEFDIIGKYIARLLARR